MRFSHASLPPKRQELNLKARPEPEGQTSLLFDVLTQLNERKANRRSGFNVLDEADEQWSLRIPMVTHLAKEDLLIALDRLNFTASKTGSASHRGHQ